MTSRLTAKVVESFCGIYLSPRYDSAKPTPAFHREAWELYCSDAEACAVAAPRSHAKSTALTHGYGLAVALFREQQFIVIISSSELMAVGHLGDIRSELQENDELRAAFGIKSIPVDQSTDVIVECEDGYQFRFIARGAEQKIRGLKWRGKRPGLIIFDDVEDDELVESKDRRRKFSQWFYSACLQALRRGGKIRGHGTILHEDSLLNHLMKDPSWKSRKYRAHRSFSDFSDILWPEQFSESVLRAKRQQMINAGNGAGYAKEYLNDPIDNDDAFLRRDEFVPMKTDDHECFKIYYAGWDFAISKADHANRTSGTIAGVDTNNVLHFIDQQCDRWDILEIIEKMFEVESTWTPRVHFVEGGAIWKAVGPLLNKEMMRRDIWLSISELVPIKDKKVRGQAFRKRMRAGACRFDKDAAWYADYEDELLRFTGNSQALLDDQFDSSALICAGLENMKDIEDSDMMTEEEEEFEKEAWRLKGDDGRSVVTGY